MHFTPTWASWLNMVERFFRNITTDRLRRGVFTSVEELTTATRQALQLGWQQDGPRPSLSGHQA